jgi:hypothetical protein
VAPIVPVSVVTADLNGDGILDAVIGHGQAANSAVTVMRGQP